MEYQKVLLTALQVAEIEKDENCSDPLGWAKVNLDLSKLSIAQIEILRATGEILRTSANIVLSEKQNVINQYLAIDPLYTTQME